MRGGEAPHPNFFWRLLAAPLAVRCPLAPPIVTFPYSRGGVEPPVGVGPPGTGRVRRRALRESSRCLRHDRRYRLPLAPVRPHPPPFQDASGNVPSRADVGIMTQGWRAGISLGMSKKAAPVTSRRGAPHGFSPRYSTRSSTSSSMSLVESWAPRAAASRRNAGLS